MEKYCPKGTVRGAVKAPTSKSYAQRAVAAALLAEGVSVLRNMELCSDTAAALDVAARLGAGVEKTGAEEYTVTGGIRGGVLTPRETLVDIGESGLSARMFTPVASLCTVPVTVTGRGSILGRPVNMMTEPLASLGVEITSQGGYLPVTVCGPLGGGEAEVDGSVSSQFITGLLMALPLAGENTTLHVSRAISTPYIDMTVDLLAKFDVRVSHNDYREFYIEGGQRYSPRTYSVEGDWSGASCLLVAGAIAGEVTVENLNPLSMQADVAIVEALARAGAQITTTADTVTVTRRPLTGFRFDATNCPDLFPALVALAANCAGMSVLKGTSRLEHKESNRALTLREEFGKLGVDVDLSVLDTMTVKGCALTGGTVDSHNDHRIAMALGTAALTSQYGLTVRDAGAVDKSYPGFWNDLAAITA
ncbi:MAG: 3-phosphoshikimate 1-carboxyvinyltransferase [Alistipes sp.]|nr:3-phosphoshikimate 1-carboxyvinyltransferase [Alistipes sp.]